MSNKVSTPAGWRTTAKERQRYWMYFAGQNMIITLVFMFLTTYLLLTGLDAMATAGILIVVKVWDAVNDVVFGGLIDKVKFKKGGKFIPWLKISLPIVAISTILLFSIPQSASTGIKLIWFAVAYILWDTAYTICDVPLYGLITTMTDSQSERTDLMSKSRITAYIGALLTMGLGYILPSEQVGMSYTTITWIIVIIAVLTMIWLCIRGKEYMVNNNEPSKEKSYTVREMFQYFKGNKYLFIYYGGLLLFMGLNTASSVLQFACFYLFDSAMIATIVAAVSFAPSVLISFIMPALLKKYDKFKMFMLFAVAYVVLSIVIWAIGPVLLPHLILTIIRGFAAGGITVLQFMFTPDCAEYGQYKTGIEAKGITFAIQTFTMKLVSAVSASLGLAVLGWFGWKSVAAESFAELATLGVTQSETALSALWSVYALIPAIGGVASILLWSRYKLKTQDAELMAKYNSNEMTREECDAQLSHTY